MRFELSLLFLQFDEFEMNKFNASLRRETNTDNISTTGYYINVDCEQVIKIFLLNSKNYFPMF